MDYSIIIPVYNREDLTQQCLSTLPATIADAGTGEVIVVDNGSEAATTAVLAGFPWVRVIRNERNLGFAAACNQGARAATGRFLVHLNNDTVPLEGWLKRMLDVAAEPDIGAVGARLLFPNDTLQHAGVLLYPARLGPEGVGPYHFLWGARKDNPAALIRTEYNVVTGACLVTPRALYAELGGFDEVFWNGYEDVDYCFKVRERGLRIVYEPSAVLYHLESQSGVQRKRRVSHNVRELASRWSQRLEPDHNRYCGRVNFVRREKFIGLQRTAIAMRMPATTAIVHGPAPADPEAWLARLIDTSPVPRRVVWLAEGPAPSGTIVPAKPPIEALCDELESRGDRYVAIIDTRTTLLPEWLPELIDGLEYASDVCASTALPPDEARERTAPLAADARATLVAPRQWPQHVRPDTAIRSIDALVVDWTYRAVVLGRSVRDVPRPVGELGPAGADDPAFVARYGMSHDRRRRADAAQLETLCEPRVDIGPVFASVIMLSWNAPQYTKMAVDSIRACAGATPYEIIIVDNGSGPETLEMLRDLTDVRIIYNKTNTGFAHGCNQGIAAARGTHVVLLNNDVLVTDGWLERLIDAFRRDPLVGVSAPRSNSVAGHQQIDDTNYRDQAAMVAYAAERARTMRGMHYRTDRAIGFCLCIARAVIDEIGGIDERYGAGNFEDDDFSIRVRAAGYQIVVCEDVFIHHFGSVTFKANNLDYAASLERNWAIFARRWGLPPAYPLDGYNAEAAIARGFDRAEHYVALPDRDAVIPPVVLPEHLGTVERRAGIVIAGVIDSESAWGRFGPLVTNYVRAVPLGANALLALAVLAPLDAVTIAQRIERLAAKAGISAERIPDIDVADVDDIIAWRATLFGERRFALDRDAVFAGFDILADRSPSGLRRLMASSSS